MTLHPASKADGDIVLRDALEREAATREILEIISRSRNDERPVFDVILQSASRLCGAEQCFLCMADDTRTKARIVAHHGQTKIAAKMGADWYPLDGSLPLIPTRTIEREEPVSIDDMADTEEYRAGNEYRVHAVEVDGIRSCLGVPLMSGGRAIGCLGLQRKEHRPFAAADVELAKTFAAQAVIAIENVRQFRELQTRLEREAATREILEVISRSRDDETPVFDVILENAARLCGATEAVIWPIVDGRFVVGASLVSDPALHEFIAENPIPLDERSAAGRSISTRAPVHIHDLQADPATRDLAVTRRVGTRTMLAVPLLLADETPVGVISIFRREVRPFADEQIALVQTFAAQAVIAIENVRQFRELQTRLEREAATREILQVISRSRADTGPVFEAILENARRLCNAPMAMLSIASEDRTRVAVPASLGAREAFAQALVAFDHPIDAPLIAVRPVADGQIIHMADCTDDDLYRERHPTRILLADVEGVRTILAVPMISNGISIGAIILYRREVQPFDDDQIELVKTFADQAAIAVENVRQFRALETKTEELRELNASLESRVAAQVGELERLGRLKRFLSPQVADAVVSSGDEKMLGSHRALIAVLFCDIRGFTAFCETAEPEETIEVLQTYHEEMGQLINAHGAGVDHRAGDGIMVIFNDPLPCDDPAGDALRMALAMRDRMAELCKGWRRLGHRLGFGVGISLGYATVGMVGSEGRYDYTASGTAVNLAARLCDEAADGEILLSPRAYAAVENDFAAESKGEISLKGISAPVEIFRVTSSGEAPE